MWVFLDPREDVSGSRSGIWPAQDAHSSAAAMTSRQRSTSGIPASLSTSSIAEAITAPGSCASSTSRNQSPAASFSKLATPHELTSRPYTLSEAALWTPAGKGCWGRPDRRDGEPVGAEESGGQGHGRGDEFGIVGRRATVG